MTQYLPSNLLALFAPRDPLPFLPPLDKPTWLRRKPWSYNGVSTYLHVFEDPKDTPPPTRAETREEKLERKKREKDERITRMLEEKLKEYNPHVDPNTEGDAFKTLFIGRINFDTSESKLRREMEIYGPINIINMVVDRKSSKPRGYAFIEYEHERDMHSAYKHADGKKIDGRRIVVDVERGRTVKTWRPRRLGGGLGGTRIGGPDQNVKHSGRVDNADRYNEERGDRDRDRDRERRERERKDRERDRGDRDRGDRDRERRERDRFKERDRDRDRRRRSRSRDKDRDRDRDRERRRDRDKNDRDRGDRERGDRGDRERRDRDRDRDREREDRDRDGYRDREERDNNRDYERDSERPKEEPGEYGEYPNNNSVHNNADMEMVD